MGIQRQDWNSPLYTAKVIKANKTPYRYSSGDDLVSPSLNLEPRDPEARAPFPETGIRSSYCDGKVIRSHMA